MRFLDVVRLREMNVANLDTIKADFTHMLDKTINDRQVTIAKPVYDLIVKRAVKAMQNDDAGTMVTRQPVRPEGLADDAPAWLRASVERGDVVYEIAFKEGFQQRLAHVLDWIRVDTDAAKAIRATPEADFLGLLAKAADDYFAKTNAEAAKQNDQSLEEPGRDVVMTFRRDPATSRIVLFQESDLAANAHGPVVSFWAKLTSPQALDREGKMMKHCVGSYADVVAAEAVVIYSLRDMKNEPHTTIEMDMRRRQPSINQVKGKANAPPLGRYGSYIKDFLNALGVPASESGARDVRGMGLLAHEGKFGTILDVGGLILAAFANGDTLRTLRAEAVYSSWQRQVTQRIMYVEKDGTVPFTFDVSLKPDDPPEQIAGKTISAIEMMRKEVSRFPLYAKQMIVFLNQKAMVGKTKTFEAIGVFFDARRPIWGTRADLTEHLFDYQGLSVSRVAEDVFMADAKGTIFATARLVRNAVSAITVINECDAVKRLPELLREIGNRVLKQQMSDKDARDYFADYGVFWNPGKALYASVPEGRTIYKAKAGHIDHYMHRLFFFDPANTLIASVFVGKESRPYEINSRQLTGFGKQGLLALYTLLSEISKQDQSLLTIGEFGARDLREMGFYIERGRMLALSEVEIDQKLGHGYTMSVRVTDYGGKELNLLKAGQEVVSVMVDDQGTTKRISYRDRALDQSDPQLSTGIAAMLNAAHVGMRSIDLFAAHLQIKNDKYAALDAKKDALILDFLRGKVTLDGGFEFHYSGRLDEFGREDNSWARRFGYIDYNYSTVCSIDFSDHSFDELVYHMRRQLPLGVTREQVIKMVAKFMHFYYSRIEPYMNTTLFRPAGRRKAAHQETDDSEEE